MVAFCLPSIGYTFLSTSQIFCSFDDNRSVLIDQFSISAAALDLMLISAADDSLKWILLKGFLSNNHL